MSKSLERAKISTDYTDFADYIFHICVICVICGLILDFDVALV
jgi:hypothetical protein